MSTIESPRATGGPQTYVPEYSPRLSQGDEEGAAARCITSTARVESIDGQRPPCPPFGSCYLNVAHGQMPEEDLSNVMQRMFEGSRSWSAQRSLRRLDIPNVNTLIIGDADHLGLAQLHQLRGRVRRSSPGRYIPDIPARKALSDVATKRLAAIHE